MSNTITERARFQILLFLLAFLMLVFDRDMALVYVTIILADFVWYFFDKSVGRKVTFVFERKRDLVKSLTLAFSGYAVFFVLSMLVTSVFSSKGSLQSFTDFLAATTPILSGSSLLVILGWVFVIPFIETPFVFGRVFEGVLEWAGINPNTARMKSSSVWFVTLFVAGLFTLLHLTAKNLDSTSLMLTFVFAVISMVLVVKEKQTISATLLHILVNGTAVLYAFRPEVFSFIGGGLF